jgi:hypothetical protein
MVDLRPRVRHVFVLTLWIETDGQTGELSGWRGHITDSLTNERRPVRSLIDIGAFLDHVFQESLRTSGHQRPD